MSRSAHEDCRPGGQPGHQPGPEAVRVHDQRHRVVLEIGSARVSLGPARGESRNERPQSAYGLEIGAGTGPCRDLDWLEGGPHGCEAERVLSCLWAGNGHPDSTLHQSGRETMNMSADPAGARREHLDDVQGVSDHHTPRQEQDSCASAEPPGDCGTHVACVGD
jgi:hypothetical protein